MRLGIFGGTFDPPHIGHLILADESLNQLKLDHILWVLTPYPPHKLGQDITPLSHRLDMILGEINANPDFSLSRIDIERPSPHYAVDTVNLIGKINPGAELVYLMGGDSLENLPQWYKPEELVNSCDSIAVMLRSGSNIDVLNLNVKIRGLASKIQFVNTPIVDISASQIRERIRTSKSFRYYLVPAVYKIIIERDLYLGKFD